MANPSVSTIEKDLPTEVGPDATSTFETGGNYAGSNPTGSAGSESLYSTRATGITARSTEDDLDEDEDDEDEDEDDDLEDDDEDEDEDDLDDEDDDLEDDDEDEEDEDDEDDDEDEDEDDEDTLKTESSDVIRGRNTSVANAATKRRM